MFKPKIGISMLHMLAEPFQTMLKRLTILETDYAEIVDDGLHTLNKKRVASLNEAASSSRIKFTLHCPIADINIASPSNPMLHASLKRLRQSMEFATELNAKLWVLHPGQITGISPFYPGSDWRQNIKSMRLLHKTANDIGLRIAIENVPQKYGSIMKTAEDFDRFYKETEFTDVGIALDVGHANLEAQIQRFLEQFPDRITHLHLSDNMGKHDQHLGVGYGRIDWQWLITRLKQISFGGTIMIESVFNVSESVTKLKEFIFQWELQHH